MLNNLDPVIAQALAPFVLPKQLTDEQQRLLSFLDERALRYDETIPKHAAELREHASQLREYFQGVRPGNKLSMAAGSYLYSIPKDQLGT